MTLESIAHKGRQITIMVQFKEIVMMGISANLEAVCRILRLLEMVTAREEFVPQVTIVL